MKIGKWDFYLALSESMYGEYIEQPSAIGETLGATRYMIYTGLTHLLK